MNRILAALAAACLLLPAVGWKKHACCMHCGCQCRTVKVCRVVCETKKVPKVCYGCECEDICVPGPSTLCGVHCECKEDPCHPGCFTKKTVLDWIPGCAYVKTRAKLTKKEIEVEQKSYKWMVEEVCPACAKVCRAESDCLLAGIKSQGGDQLAAGRKGGENTAALDVSLDGGLIQPAAATVP